MNALLAALTSALVLVTAFMGYELHGRWPNTLESHTWPAAAFSVAQGNGRAVGGTMHLRAAPGQQAIAVVDHIALQTRKYPYLRLDIERWSPGTEVSLLWLTRVEPTKVRWIPLQWGTRFVRIAANPHWHGVVTTIGLAINDPKGSELSWRLVSARPINPTDLLHAVFSQWTAFEPWSLHSTNYIVGGQKHPIVSPVVAIAAWVALASLFYLATITARRRHPDWRVVGALVVIAWLMVDGGWQFNLLRQLRVTHDQYAGKSQTEKHLTEIGGDVFGFIQQVRRHLPAKPVRIFVLTDDPDGAGRFYRLRALYDLLPENVYAYSQYPPPPHLLRPGDYLVTLGTVPGLSFDATDDRLRWGKQQLPVTRTLVAAGGRLYKVR